MNELLGPSIEDVITTREARSLVSMGIWDPSGMDPIVDRIFEPGVAGFVRREDGSLHLVRDISETQRELDEHRALEERNFALFPDAPRPEAEGYVPPEPPSDDLTGLIDNFKS